MLSKRRDWEGGIKRLNREITVFLIIICFVKFKTGNEIGKELTTKIVTEMCMYCLYFQACWGPNDDSVVFVGWFHEPYRLGLKYCPIRK